MKKMKLKSLGLNVNDLLTREQLKKIYGGSGSGGSGGDCIPDGQPCKLFKKCCNECLPTFICGKRNY